jgi:hypothetical protein
VTTSRIITDHRSGFYVDASVGYGNRPTIQIQQRCPIMYLDRGQDRRTLLDFHEKLGRLLRDNENPLRKRKPVEVSDPAHCGDCGYLEAECVCV